LREFGDRPARSCGDRGAANQGQASAIATRDSGREESG
jgi:hypothetical protein